MINHNAPSGIFSAYNPIVTLKPKIKRKVNEEFIARWVEFGQLIDETRGLLPRVEEATSGSDFGTDVL